MVQLVRFKQSKTDFEEWESVFWSMEPLAFSSVALSPTNDYMTSFTRMWSLFLDQYSGQLFQTLICGSSFGPKHQVAKGERTAEISTRPQS